MRIWKTTRAASPYCQSSKVLSERRLADLGENHLPPILSLLMVLTDLENTLDLSTSLRYSDISAVDS
jgi:hypothetical protein